jgi:hypothetical protein
MSIWRRFVCFLFGHDWCGNPKHDDCLRCGAEAAKEPPTPTDKEPPR